MIMNSAEAPRKASPADIQRYVSAVDDLLLDVPWRRRCELIAGLREHLRESPELITQEPPQGYAAELRATVGAVPGGQLSGLRSPFWPTPVQWWESVLRAGAVVLVVRVAVDFLGSAGEALLGDRSALGSWWSMVDQALQTVYPVPRIFGTHLAGLLVSAVLSVVVGQLITDAVLQRAPHRRRLLRRLTYVSLVVVMALLAYGAWRTYF